jgi:putative Holliday junction resolvase
MIFDSLQEFLPELPNEGRLIGIDLGQSRIGVATCDELRMIATPREVYERRNMSKDLGHINRIIEDEYVVGVVLGLPLELDGKESEGCERARHFANKLFKKSGRPILLKDERLSTAAVTRTLKEYDMTRKRRHSLDDQLAAAYILQQVVDAMPRG